MENMAQETEVKEEDPEVGMSVIPLAIGFSFHGITSVRGSKLALGVNPFSTLLSYVLAPFGMVRGNCQNE